MRNTSKLRGEPIRNAAERQVALATLQLMLTTLVATWTGLLPAEISCHLKTFVDGRALDDYGTAIVRFENGALGTVTASQISHGRENDLFIEIDGTKGSLIWRQENPNEMIVRENGQPHKIFTRDPNASVYERGGGWSVSLA